MNFWKRKLDAYLHDPPEKALDLVWHKQRADAYEAGLDLDDVEYHHPCDHMAAAADRLPWPRYTALSSSFDGQENFFHHPLGGAEFRIKPYPSADLAHEFASLSRPQLVEGGDRAQFLAFWRLWRWWAADRNDSRLAFLPADTRLPDHTIWAHNAMVSAFQSCVCEDGAFRPAFLLFQMGPV
jgi:CRISPR-associated protein Cmr2